MGWITALALGGLVAFSTNTLAQDKKEKPSDSKPAAGERTGPRRAGQGGQLAMMKEQLKLTDDQSKKLEPILKEQTEKMRALRDDKNMAPEDRRTKSREIREAYTTKIKAVLTKDQAEQWEKARQQRPGGQGGQGGPRGPRGQGGQPAQPAQPK